jgi:hypothetical protein
MSVVVNLKGPRYSLEFAEDADLMALTDDEVAEQWALVLERLAAIVRRACPPPGAAQGVSLDEGYESRAIRRVARFLGDEFTAGEFHAWLTTPLPSFNNCTPLEGIRQGKAPDVLDAARYAERDAQVRRAGGAQVGGGGGK